MHSSKKMLFVGTISLVLAPYLVGAAGGCSQDLTGAYVVTNNSGRYDPNSLVSCIDEANAEVYGRVIFDSSMDIALYEEMYLDNDNVTVDAQEHIINISNNGERIVNVFNDGVLTLKGVNIVNAEVNNLSDSLINIYTASLVLDNVTIANNTLTSDAYNLIKATSSTVTIQNDSNISQNNSNFTLIEVVDSNITISDSILNNNITQDDSDSSIISVRGSNLSITNSEVNENEPKNYVLEAESRSTGPGAPSIPSNVDITDSTFSTNTSNSSPVYIRSSSISINNSTISNNNNTGEGGGGLSLSSSSVVLNNSSISNNNSDDNGGGLSLYSSSLALTNTTISGNSASMSGGGIYSTLSSVNIKNSTITENTAIFGGGIYAYWQNSINILNTTITNNSVTVSGGGIYSYENYDVNISNTILSGNMTSNSSADANEIRSLGYNIFGAVTSFTDESQQPSDIITLDPKLDPLADNGGDTQTHALQKDSPAIDAGYSTIPLDQRGEDRDSSPDIGAYEYQSLGTIVPIINYLLF